MDIFACFLIKNNTTKYILVHKLLWAYLIISTVSILSGGIIRARVIYMFSIYDTYWQFVLQKAHPVYREQTPPTTPVLGVVCSFADSQASSDCGQASGGSGF